MHNKIQNKINTKIAQNNNFLILILIICISSILIMDLFLKKMPAPYEIMFVIGNLYYNVCLSYIASFIFYIVTVYIPQQKKKKSVYRYVHNKILTIQRLELQLLNVIINGSILCSFNEEIKLKELKKDVLGKKCTSINPHEPVIFVSTMGVFNFKNWFQLINFISNEIKGNVNDLFAFQDSLSTDVITSLTHIDDDISQHINETKGNSIGNKSMDIYSYGLWDLHTEIINLIKLFKKDNPKILNYIKKHN